MSDGPAQEPVVRSRKRIWLLALFAMAALLGVLILGNWSAGQPETLGVKQGRLAECPDSPNCVSSQEDREPHQVAPLRYQGDGQAAFARLIEMVENWPRARIITQTDHYLHAEFTTPVLRFVDDVEFLLAEEENVIHVRSASRVGHSDLGKNRKRVQALRTAFEAGE